MYRMTDREEDNLKPFDNEPERNIHKNKKSIKLAKAEEIVKEVLEVDEADKAAKQVEEVKNTKAIVDPP